ncbi:uncharacterized protein LOC118412412 [Branchiostoma floridae]|uniref:Uncharacterized protein LOC118412412 n=1 Tax=Branchiostoma floridae TaxID=7739 RepID=A0A9J7KVF1_BRAFL|nr:uncharacterized protein LOC118412412 [Branchiostoma floridae]
MAFLRSVKLKDVDPALDVDAEEESDDINNWDDFDAVGEDRPVGDVISFMKEHGHEFSPYAVDWARETVLFVRTQEDVDIKEHFYLQLAQRTYVQELLSIPISQLQAVADAVAEKIADVQNIFVYMSARCGSTLVVKATNVLPSAMAVDGPDVYSIIALAYDQVQEGKSPGDASKIPDVLLNRESTIAFVKNISTLYNYYFFSNDVQRRSTIMYKFKSHVITFAKVLAEAHPEAQTLFMYRDGMKMAESSIRLNHGGCKKDYDTWVEGMKSEKWKRRQHCEDNLDLMPEYYFIFGDDPKLKTPPHDAHQVYYYMTFWLGVMQKALDLHREDPEHFFRAVINYRALVDRKEEAFLEMMEKIGVTLDLDDTENKAALAKVFHKDSQSGTVITSHKEEEKESWKPHADVWFGEWERRIFNNIVKRAKLEVNDPAFVFPDTIF